MIVETQWLHVPPQQLQQHIQRLCSETTQDGNHFLSERQWRAQCRTCVLSTVELHQALSNPSNTTLCNIDYFMVDYWMTHKSAVRLMNRISGGCPKPVNRELRA